MKLKAVLFDLDGTLLPMNQETFVKAYFGGLAARLAPHGYDAKLLIDAIWAGTAAMVKNTGEKRNEEVFWDRFAEIFGEQVREDLPLFDAFYREDFDRVQASCGYDARAKLAVEKIKAKGLRVALATNPIFPAMATESRIRWAGLSPDDFELYTTYENSCYCKPNPAYYASILERMGLRGEDCLMVGNDVSEDMVAETLGMKVFLLTDCIINKENKDISVHPHGGFDVLLDYIDDLEEA